MIDFAGPGKFARIPVAREFTGFYLYTVSDSREPAATLPAIPSTARGRMRFVPTSPTPTRIAEVVMMGARGQHTGKLAWIRMLRSRRILLSDCTVAFLLAKTGLLDGLSATAHHDLFDSFESNSQGKLVRARYVDKETHYLRRADSASTGTAYRRPIYGRERAEASTKWNIAATAALYRIRPPSADACGRAARRSGPRSAPRPCADCR